MSTKRAGAGMWGLLGLLGREDIGEVGQAATPDIDMPTWWTEVPVTERQIGGRLVLSQWHFDAEVARGVVNDETAPQELRDQAKSDLDDESTIRQILGHTAADMRF